MWSSPDFTALLPYIHTILNQAGCRDFLVFDIDDTVLNGMGDGVTPVEPGLELVREAESRNLGVYYVTARPEFPRNRLQTYDDLKKVGIHDPALVIMRPLNVTSWDEIGRFKKRSRSMIGNIHGGKCVLTVGDKWTDMLTVDEAQMDNLNHTIGDKYSLFQFVDTTGWGLKLRENII